jgi:hypothetical protein
MFMKNTTYSIKISLALMALLVASAQLIGQTNERVTVIGTFQPSLGTFLRIPATPEAVQTTFEPVKFDYNFLDNVIETKTELESIPPLQVTPERRGSNYNNYLRAAIGSRLSPYFLYRHNSPLSNNTRFGLGLRHFSSWLDMADYAPSDFMQNRMNLNLEHEFRDHSLGFELYYQYNTYRFYGFKPSDFPKIPVDKKAIFQRFSTAGARATFQSNYDRSTALHHKIDLDYYYLMDNYSSSEHGAKASLNLQKDYEILHVDSKQSLALDADYSFYLNQDLLATAYVMDFGLVPSIVLDGSFYFLKAGVRLNLDMGDSSRFHIYPAVQAKLFLLESAVEIYSNFGGGLQRLSFKNLTDMNPYVNSILPLHWENTSFSFHGGFKAAFIQNLELHFGVGYQLITDKSFFVTDKSILLNNLFTLDFDDVQLFQFTAEAAYKFNELIGLHLNYSMNEYTMTNLMHPWHEPLSVFKARLDVNPIPKISFQAELIAGGTRYAPNYIITNNITVEEVIELAPYFDLNLGAEYRFNERFTSFVTINNLLNSKYPRFLNYPVYGLQAFAGISYSF